jgi:hypothetical protein
MDIVATAKAPFQALGLVGTKVDPVLFEKAKARIESGDKDGCYSRPGIQRHISVNRYMSKQRFRNADHYTFLQEIGDSEHPEAYSRYQRVFARTDDRGNLLHVTFRKNPRKASSQFYPLDLTKDRFQLLSQIGTPIMTKESLKQDAQATWSDFKKKWEYPKHAEKLANQLVTRVLNDQSLECSTPKVKPGARQPTGSIPKIISAGGSPSNPFQSSQSTRHAFNSKVAAAAKTQKNTIKSQKAPNQTHSADGVRLAGGKLTTQSPGKKKSTVVASSVPAVPSSRQRHDKN